MAAVLRGMVAERPKDPQALQYLAMAEAASGDPASAARALRRAIELEPGRAVLWESLGEANGPESAENAHSGDIARRLTCCVHTQRKATASDTLGLTPGSPPRVIVREHMPVQASQKRIS